MAWFPQYTTRFSRAYKFAAEEAHKAGFLVFSHTDHAPDAVLLDLDLPLMNGFAVHTALQLDERTRRLPIVIVTGTGWNGPSPAAATLIKPVSPDDLVKVMFDALARSQAQDLAEFNEIARKNYDACRFVGDAYAIYGFSGQGRDNVEFFRVKSFVERVSRGIKSRRKIAIVAPARKLLVMLRAMPRDGTSWRDPRAGECVAATHPDPGDDRPRSEGRP